MVVILGVGPIHMPIIGIFSFMLKYNRKSFWRPDSARSRCSRPRAGFRGKGPHS